MPTDLVESGVVVVSLAEEQAALAESGLMVISRAEPDARLVESGLVVIAQAELDNRLIECGIIVIHEVVEASGRVLIQGEGILRDITLQGQELVDGPFYPDPN